MNDIYSTQEVANLLDLSPRTIITWIDKGKMPAYKTLGGHRRIKKDDLVVFLNDNGMPIPDSLVQPTIIVIDDDDTIRENIVNILRQKYSDIVIKGFDSTIDALVEIQTGKNHIIVVDIVMPYMDGLELCARIKKNELTKNARIIAISGYLSASNNEEVIAAGADDFYCKDQPIEVLLEKVNNLLNRRIVSMK